MLNRLILLSTKKGLQKKTSNIAKEKNKKERQRGVVYEITSEDCKEKYLGETARMLGTRLKEHTTTKGLVSSAIAEHMKDSGHRIKNGQRQSIRKGRTAITGERSRRHPNLQRQPAPNRHQGIEITTITLKLLSCGHTGSHDE